MRPATKKIVLHLIAFMVQVTEQSDCGAYRAENGKICHMCNPGNYKIGDCMEDGMSARCLPCPNGTYQTTCNQALSCASCSQYCQIHYSTKISECNKTSDIKCQCDTGFYFKGDVNGKCIKHKSCPAGQGVKMQGTPFNDTVCEPCIPGKTFSNVSSSMERCQNCTTCPTISECTPVNDTMCAIVTDQHGLSIGHIIGIVGACVVGIIVVICVAIAVGYYQLHKNQKGKPRNPYGECPQEVLELHKVAAIQGAPPKVSQVAPLVVGHVALPVAGQIVPPEANDLIYRRNEEMNEIPITDQLDNERSTEEDTEVDAEPISDSDVHLHHRHFASLSERQDAPNHHEQPGVTRQDNIAINPNKIGVMDQHKGPSGNNTLAIPTEKTVDKILQYLARSIIKDFPMFFRKLYQSTASKSDWERQDVNALIEQMHSDNKDNVVEANYQLLKRWLERYGRADENLCTIISNALRHSGANKILSNLQLIFRPHFATNGGNEPVRGEI